MTANDGAALDQLGFAIAVSGTTVVVGASAKTVGSRQGQGAAYVYECVNSSTCIQFSELLASNGDSYNYFGSAVAISSSTIVVGAYYKNFGQGSAYIFSCVAGSCAQGSEIFASDGETNDFFGNSVAIYDSLVVVGALQRKIGINGYQGAAYIFSCVNAWSCTQGSELTGNNGVAFDYFGTSVAISGSMVVIGAKGKAFVFSCEDALSCTQFSRLTANDGTNDGFGNSVSTSGSVVVVGAYDQTNSTQGAAYVFSCVNALSCTQDSILTANNSGDKFGSAIAVSASLIVVGAWQNTLGVNSATYGAAFVYSCVTTSSCTQGSKIIADNGAASDHFAFAVAVSGSHVVIGAYQTTVDSNYGQGEAYSYTCGNVGICNCTTGWSGSECDVATNSPAPPLAATAIIGGVLGGIALLLSIILLSLYWRRQRQRRRAAEIAADLAVASAQDEMTVLYRRSMRSPSIDQSAEVAPEDRSTPNLLLPPLSTVASGTTRASGSQSRSSAERRRSFPVNVKDLPKDHTKWTSDDVGVWLQSLGVADAALTAFKKKQVTGDVLAQCTDEATLAALGVTVLNDIVKIREALGQLQSGRLLDFNFDGHQKGSSDMKHRDELSEYVQNLLQTDYTTWTVEDVGRWLFSARVSKKGVNVLVQNKVSGAVLAHFGSEDRLRDIGVASASDRATIASCITMLVETAARRRSTDNGRVSVKAGSSISRNDLAVGEVLASGQFGQVFRGTFRGARVAIKTPAAIDDAVREDFLCEADLMKSIPPHPNVVQYFGVCVHESELYLVIDYCDLGSLQHYIQHHPDTSVKTLVTIGAQVAAAMSHLSEFIVHRDLAARNILLATSGGSIGVMARVADFGLSRPKSGAGYMRMTLRHPIPIPWTATEVLEGEPHTTAADVWSFAVVLWEMFEGCPRTPPEHNREQVPSLSQPGRCPVGVFALMTRCWAVNPQERPTFEFVFADLTKMARELA